MSLSYGNQLIDLQSQWFLYDVDIRYQRLKYNCYSNCSRKIYILKF